MRLGIARGHGTSSADSKVAILCYKAKSRVGRLLRRLHLNENTKLDCKTMWVFTMDEKTPGFCARMKRYIMQQNSKSSFPLLLSPDEFRVFLLVTDSTKIVKAIKKNKNKNTITLQKWRVFFLLRQILTITFWSKRYRSPVVFVSGYKPEIRVLIVRCQAPLQKTNYCRKSSISVGT